MRTVEANQASEDLRNRVAQQLRYTVERQYTERTSNKTIAAFDDLYEAVTFAEMFHARLDGACMVNVWDEKPEARNGHAPSAVRVHVLYRAQEAA